MTSFASLHMRPDHKGVWYCLFHSVYRPLVSTVWNSMQNLRYVLVSFPDLLAKACLAKPLAAFGKTFVRRSGKY